MNNELIRKIKHNEEEFHLFYIQDRWWYLSIEVAKYLEYEEAKSANRIINDTHKLNLKKKGNEELFNYVGAAHALSSKTPNLTFIDEDGLIVLAMNSNKPNAKLLVEDMIRVFKVELDKAGLDALNYLLRIEKDNNLLVNAKAQRYYNEGKIKYIPMRVNISINELVFYKYFPNEKFGNDINTEKLRECINSLSGYQDRDISLDRYEVGMSILEMMYNYYLFNDDLMSIRKAKYLYAKSNNYEDQIVKMFKERLDT